MDTKATNGIKRKLNELATQHNRLTTLCAFLLNEVSGLKKELHASKSSGGSSMKYNANDIKTVNTNSGSNSGSRSTPNFSELKADEILKQLSINNLDN